MKKAILLICIMLSALAATAQHSHTIRGRIVDNAGKPVNGFTAVVMNETDSMSVVDKYFANGAFELTYNADRQKNMLLYLAAYGYQSRYLRIDPITSDMGTIGLDSLALQIKEVVVSGYAAPRHAFVRGKDEFTIPSSIAEKEFSLYTLLQKIPGLDATDNSVKIIGTGTPIFMINGLKPRPGEVAALRPEMIEKIVIDRMPSAKYDKNVEGILNIVTKKTLRDYLSVRVVDNFQQQNVPGNNAAVQINNQIGRWSNFFRYSNSYSRNKMEMINNTTTYYSGGTYQKNKFGTSDNTSLSHNFTYSPRIEVSKRGFIDFQYTYNSSSSNSSGTDDLDFVNRELNFARSKSKSAADKHDMLLRYYNKFENNSSLVTNVGYSTYHDKSHDIISEHVIPQQGNPSDTETIQDAVYKNKVLTASIEYEAVLFKKIDLGIGGNYGLLMNNSRSYYPNTSSESLTDRKESQAAAYLNLGQEWKKFSYNLGLRMEYRYRHAAPDKDENKNPFEFVPSISLSYEVSDKVNMTLYYRRTTTYPSIGQLNPIPSYINKYQYFVGNPDLKPSINNVLRYRLSLPANLSLDLSYSNIDDQIERMDLVDKDDFANSYTTLINLEKYQAFSTTATWWGQYAFYTIMASFSYTHNFDKSPFLGKPNKRNKPNLYGRIQNNFTLSKNINASVSFYYDSPYDGVGGTWVGQQYGLNVNMNFAFLKRKLLVSVGGQNLIYTNTNFKTKYLQIYSDDTNITHDRRFTIGVTYKFNNFKDIFQKNESNATILERAQ